MKTLCAVLLSLALSSSLSGQISSVSFTTAAGYTFVNLYEAVGVDQLEDWDNLGIMFKANVDYRFRDKVLLVGEVGSNRLYYWEYYWSDGYYDGYRWSSSWTTNLGVHLKLYLMEQMFLQLGLGAYFYNNGTGVVPGDVVQLGYEIPTSGNFAIPIVIRMENVMGDGFPVSVLLGSGLTFKFRK